MVVKALFVYSEVGTKCLRIFHLSFIS